MTTLIYWTKFDAAHWLPDYDGPCARLHGHTWKVEIEIEGPVDPKTGMIADFKDIKAAVGSILPDHQCLNTCYLPGILRLPTAERLAEVLYRLLAPLLPGLKSLTIWESDHAAARYTAD
jgi:6-pyruvoyltetrahydropterin/6-carboxytetrahydropterin synthase